MKNVIKEARKYRGITIVELAKRTGITKNGIWNIENDITGVSLKNAYKICKELGFRIEILFPEFDEIEYCLKEHIDILRRTDNEELPF